jgi:hypothetical protein
LEEIWYEDTIGDKPKILLLKFLPMVITKWWEKKLVRRIDMRDTGSGADNAHAYQNYHGDAGSLVYNHCNYFLSYSVCSG